MYEVITYSNKPGGSTMAQLKLKDGSRIMISVTNKEVAIFKQVFFGLFPAGKVWVEDTSKLLESFTERPSTLLDDLIAVAGTAQSVGDVPSVMKRVR